MRQQDSSDSESTDRYGNFQVKIPKDLMSDPRPELKEFIDDKAMQLRLYSDKEDKKQGVMIKLEKEIKVLESIEKSLDLLPADWANMVRISEAVKQMSSLMDYDGLLIDIDFKPNARWDRSAYLKFSLA